jgi:6-phosphogluconolactonase/glucosamine-6-phosphate isomerase/deaminase
VLLTSDPSGQNRFPRMTLTPHAFAAVRRIVFTVSGEDKREAMEAVRSGEDLPATRVTGREILWLVDRAAAGV